MITCPVCEHTQSRGEECENCGKRLASGTPDATPVTRLPELQHTRLTAALPQVPVEPMPGLDRHHEESARLPPAPPLPELERHAAAPVGPKTAAPSGEVTCRYCRNVQATGLLCDRCGMRLPRVARAQTTAPKTAPSTEEGYARCPRCRLMGRAGKACQECGAELVPSEP